MNSWTTRFVQDVELNTREIFGNNKIKLEDDSVQFKNLIDILPDTLAHRPSMASISLMSIPLPMPPKEGLQDISPENTSPKISIVS